MCIFNVVPAVRSNKVIMDDESSCFVSFRLQKQEIRTEYEGVSKRFRTESITKYTLTAINTR
jgi:hypothetical protein